MHRDGNGHVEIISFPPKDRVRLHLDGDVEITVLAAAASDVSLARHADPRVVRQARRQADGERLGAHLHLLAAAGRAACLPEVSRSAAVRARLREHHMPARRLHHARTVALHAARLVDRQPSHTLAGAAVFLPRHGHRALAAADRLLEGDAHRLMQVDATLRRTFRAPRVALLEHVREQIAERRCVGAVHADGEVEPFEAERGTTWPLVHCAGGVVTTAPIRIDERLVSLRDLPELRFSLVVARIDIRMVPPRQPLVRALDVGDRCAALNAEDDVEVHTELQMSDCRGQIELQIESAINLQSAISNLQSTHHCFPSSTTSASMTSPCCPPLAPAPAAGPEPAESPPPACPEPGDGLACCL